LISELKMMVTKDVEEIVMTTDDCVTRRTRKRKLGNQQQSTMTNPTTANSSSQSQPGSSQSVDIFKVKLRSEDFRAGTRNKHIDAFSVSPKGFLVGGTNHGEIFLWKVNFNAIRNKKTDGLYQWISSFKVSKKPNHYLQFNSTGDILITGSADGTAQIYDTSFGTKTMVPASLDEDSDVESGYISKFEELPLKDIELGESQLIHRFEEKNQKHEITSAIDSIEWSVNGRYAFCAFSIKKQKDMDNESKDDKENTSQAIVKVKVYDTYSGEVIDNLNKSCNYTKKLTGFCSIMKAHPFNDDILMVCYDCGINILYDVRQRQVV
jgi:WD40 repeat protein